VNGILLVNTGSPKSPHPKDVRTYLKEFLLDPRVLDMPFFARQALVRCVIVPFRTKQSASSYQAIWTEQGSSLVHYTKRTKELLQKSLGTHFLVEFAMLYGGYSIQEAIDCLHEKGATSLTIVPLFPQYASATTGSVFDKVFTQLKKYSTILPITTISHFSDHTLFHKAWADRAKEYDLSTYDHILFSYHGLPLRQLVKAGCCQKKYCDFADTKKSGLCYKAHAEKITQGICKILDLAQDKYTICFQSRLGREKWLEPYTTKTLIDRAKRGDKKLLVFSPSFVADCLETYYELDIEAKEQFLDAGGKTLDVVRSLNDHPSWILALKDIVERKHENVKNPAIAHHTNL